VLTPRDSQEYPAARSFFTSRFVDPVTPSNATPEILHLARSLKSLCLIELLLCIVALCFNYTIVITSIPTNIMGIIACSYLRKQIVLMFSILKLFGIFMWVWLSSSLVGLWTTSTHLPFTVILFFILFYQILCFSFARRLYTKITLLETRDPATVELDDHQQYVEESPEVPADQHPQQQPQQKFLPAENYLPTEYFTPGQQQPYPPYNYYPQYAAPNFHYPQGMPSMPPMPPHLMTAYPMMMPYPPGPMPPTPAAPEVSPPVQQPTYVVADEPVASPKSSDRDALL